MGRDWYWAKSSSNTNTKRAPQSRDSAPSPTTIPTGCISAVFHLFHFQFPFNHHTSTSSGGCSCFKPNSFLSPAPDATATAAAATTITMLKGAEAPRNSLESEDGSTSASANSVSFTSTSKEEENINIPMGIQIKTVGGRNNESCSEISRSSSPGGAPKTPTLVARLMGLDQLPEESRSPSFSSNKSYLKPNNHLQVKNIISGHRKSLDGNYIMGAGARSLPETPRISSARKSDVDIHHHRLSLQINKENMSPLSSTLKRRDQEILENRSPGHYARQIVKQVKESVSRKVGLDITNTVRSREELVRNRASTKVSADESISPGKNSTHSSWSPRLRFLESKSKDPEPPKSSTPEINTTANRVLQKPKFGSSRLKKPQQTSDIIRNKQEEPFVSPSTANRVLNISPDKKCRKTPLSNGLLSVPTLVPVKKDASLPTATKIPQKPVLDAQRPKRSSQLSSCSSQTYNKQETTQAHDSRENINNRCKDATSSTTTGDEAEYYEYIVRILRRTGLDKGTTDMSSFTSHWFSPAHPLDPSIFYYLEHFTNCNNYKTNSRQLSHRCNRKLLFHLVDEILVGILKPYFNMKPWVGDYDHGFISDPMMMMMMVDGCRLIETLCSKIRSFPQADCRVLEDIDALIDKDLPEMKVQSLIAYEEEGEGIVKEIEKHIIEALLHETAADFGVCTSRVRDRDLRGSHGSFT